MNFYNHIIETIGNTPMVKLNKVVDTKALVLAKLESFNPGHSTKDRMALKMIEDAEKSGLLKKGGTVIEGTSGNTGMGLALACIQRGYKLICTISDKQSKEKMDILKAMGAEVYVCPTNVEPDHPESYYSVAKRLNKEIPNSFYPNQYDNLSNRLAHYETEDTIRKRHKFVNESLINTFLKQDKDVIIVLGHYCNWEWALLASSLNFDAEMIGIYKPLSSKFWNEQILNIRSQFGATLVSMKESVRYLLKTRKKARVIGILTDQTPSADELNYWINFLNQKTPVFLGAEKLANKLECPIFFAHIMPLSRAKYEIKFELITEATNQFNEGEITRFHSQILENNIKRNPAYWLWSHRRWKHQQK